MQKMEEVFQEVTTKLGTKLSHGHLHRLFALSTSSFELQS
jgi:hypothetical protein